MGILDVEPSDLTVVLLPLGEQILLIGLLHHRITGILLVAQDGLYEVLAPCRGTFRSLDPHPFQLLSNLIECRPFQEPSIYVTDVFGLFLVDHQPAILALVVPEDGAVAAPVLAVLEPLVKSPQDILRNGAGLLLCDGTHDGEEHLPL